MLNRRTIVLAGAILVVLTETASGQQVQTSKPSGSERLRSERLAAVQAAGLGFQLQEWLADARQAAVASPATSLASSSMNMAIDVAAGIVGVSLVPSPAEATKTLPRESVQRISSAAAIHKQWRVQISQGLLTNEYLLAHYLVGESVGHLRYLLDLSNESSVDMQSQLEGTLGVTRVTLATPHVELSAGLRAKWLDIAQELMVPRRTPEQNSTLKTRLELWFDAFSAEAEARAK